MKALVFIVSVSPSFAIEHYVYYYESTYDEFECRQEVYKYFADKYNTSSSNVYILRIIEIFSKK